MEYSKRRAVESLFSGLKRTMGSTSTSRQREQLMVEAAFKALDYALRRQAKLKCRECFQQSKAGYMKVASICKSLTVNIEAFSFGLMKPLVLCSKVLIHLWACIKY
jgi:hypothetical protein